MAVLLLTSSCSWLEVKRYICNAPKASEAEIKQIAEETLTQFCLRQKLDRTAFETQSPRLAFDEKEKIWVIDYQSSQHFIRFIIDNCGSIETSLGPAGKTTKIE